MTDFSAPLVDRVAAAIVKRVGSPAPGHCMRLDHLLPEDCGRLQTAIERRLKPGRRRRPFVVRVLGRERTPGDDTVITSERAIELRNRKAVALLLLVPVGTDNPAASSLENSFEALPLDGLLLTVIHTATHELPQDVADIYTQVKRATSGRAFAVTRQAAAEYVTRLAQAHTAAGGDAVTLAGRELWRMGLIPDEGGPSFVTRLERNARCVVALAQPPRPQSDARERLAACQLERRAPYADLEEFLVDEGPRLAERSWLAKLADDTRRGTLTFEAWPLTDLADSDLTSLTVDPFLDATGQLVTASGLRPDAEGGMPSSATHGGSVTITWATSPKTATGVARWRVELVPSVELYGDETDFDVDLPSRVVARNAIRKAKLPMDLDPGEGALPGVVAVRVTALDASGQMVRLADGSPAQALSQEFALDPDDVPVERGNRRVATALSLPLARLLAERDGHAAANFGEVSEGWQDGDLAYLRVRFSRRAAIRLGLSVGLRDLERRAIAEPDRLGAYELTMSGGTTLAVADATPLLPPRSGGTGRAFLAARRELFAAIAAQPGRGVVEAVEFDGPLRDLTVRYTAAYARALGRDPKLPSTRALLTVDSLDLRIVLGEREVRAKIVLPTHPLRLAWHLGYSDELNRWREQLRAMPAAARRGQLDDALLERVSPAQVPHLILGAGDVPYVFIQNIRFSCGLYLPVDDGDPAGSVAAVIHALGLPTSDVSLGEIPASRLARRLRDYRASHGNPRHLRLVASNIGSGAFLAQALREINAAEDGLDAASAPPHISIDSYGPAAHTNPLAALRELQRETEETRDAAPRSFLDPLLTLSAADPDALADAPDAHLAVVADLSRPDVTVDPVTPAIPSFRGLIAQPLTRSVGDNTWLTGVSLSPARAGDATEVVETQRRHAAALARVLRGTQDGNPPASDSAGPRAVGDSRAEDDVPGTGEPEPTFEGGSPQVRVRLRDADRATLDLLHERSDWVVLLDRFLGLDAFDPPRWAPRSAGRRYILDYGPDFLDGLGHRMAVTTGHRADIEKMLMRAMEDLGFTRPEETVSSVVDELRLVSGRLILAAAGDDVRAREAVALGAVVAKLRHEGYLTNTIIIPVDAHPEVFGVAARRVHAEPARRCDLLLIRFPSTRRISIEAVEVKARATLANTGDLARSIAEQVESTITLLDRMLFAEPGRVDRPLQRARLASMLRFYLERAVRHGLVMDAEVFSRMRGAIDRLEVSDPQVTYTRTGYIATLGDRAGDSQASGFTAGIEFGETHIHVLTRADIRGATREQSVVDGQDSAHPEIVEPDRLVTVDPSGGSGSPPAVVRVPLGTTFSPEEEPVWEASTRGSPHLFVLGIPGQGKSETTIRLIQGAVEQRLAPLVLDFHGQFAADPRRPNGIGVYDATAGLPFSPFELIDAPGQHAHRISAQSIADIFGYVCNLGEIQRDVVYEALVAAYESRGHGSTPRPDGTPTIAEVRAAIVQVAEARSVSNVIARCRPLLDYGLFADAGEVPLRERIRDGMVIDVHGFADVEQAQVAVGAFLLRKVYKDMFSWGQTGEMRLAVVLDEAHRLARDLTLPKIMKEGRKFGVAVLAASQGTDDFHPDVLSNAGTKIVFRLNHPQSRKAAAFLRPRAGRELAGEIEQLPVGQAFVQSAAMGTARRTRMYRPTPPG